MRANLPLSLSLHMPSGAIALAALPWELLWDPRETTPLLLSRGLAGRLTRHLDLAQAVPPARTGGKPLRVRAIAPHAGMAQAARAAELASRTAAWAPLANSGAVALLPELSPATSEGVATTLRTGGPLDVLHFVGQGYVKDGEGHLLLDRADGNWAPTPVSQLAPAITDAGVSLVVLAACQSASVAGVDGSMLGGVAPALIAHGVPMVVAMQLTVRQDAANAATRVIYEQLAAGSSVQAAVAKARLHLWTSEPDRASWYVPTLYARTSSEGEISLVQPA